MAIKKFYSNKNKAGWKFDKRKKNFYSWGFDIYLANGKRKRESGFGTKQLAESAVARIKLGEKNKKYELVDYTKFPTCAELFQKRVDNTKERGEKNRSKRVLQTILDLLAEQGLADLKINELTTSHINLYAERRQTEDVKDETINRDLRVVRATLNQAKDFFPYIENFIPPKVRFLKVEKTRRERIVQAVELKSILFHLLKPQEKEESEKLFLSRKRAGLLFLLSAVTGATGRANRLESIRHFRRYRSLTNNRKENTLQNLQNRSIFPTSRNRQKNPNRSNRHQSRQIHFLAKRNSHRNILQSNPRSLRSFRHRLRTQSQRWLNSLRPTPHSHNPNNAQRSRL